MHAGPSIITSPSVPSRASAVDSSRGVLDSRKAHNGAVSAILPTPDGLHVLTAGNDDRLQLWDAAHLHNRVVNYPHARSRAKRAKQCAVTDNSRLAFLPSGNGIQVYDVLSGRLLSSLAHGHYDLVNCCAYNADLEELYSGANDNRILAWQVSPPPDDAEDEAEGGEADDWGD